MRFLHRIDAPGKRSEKVGPCVNGRAEPVFLSAGFGTVRVGLLSTTQHPIPQRRVRHIRQRLRRTRPCPALPRRVHVAVDRPHEPAATPRQDVRRGLPAAEEQALVHVEVGLAAGDEVGGFEDALAGGDFGDVEALDLLVAGVVTGGLINKAAVGAELPARRAAACGLALAEGAWAGVGARAEGDAAASSAAGRHAHVRGAAIVSAAAAVCRTA